MMRCDLLKLTLHFSVNPSPMGDVSQMIKALPSEYTFAVSGSTHCKDGMHPLTFLTQATYLGAPRKIPLPRGGAT